MKCDVASLPAAIRRLIVYVAVNVLFCVSLAANVTYAASEISSLHILSTPDSLTLYVPQSVSLNGFQFGTIVDGKPKLTTLSDSFSALLLTGGMASTNNCYVYQVTGTKPPLSQYCAAQVFRVEVAPADVFWYDSVRNQLRDLGVFRDGQPTGAICSAALPDCTVSWDAPTVIISPTSQPVPTFVPASTPIPLGFPGSPVTQNADWKPVYQTFDGIEMALVPVGCFMMGSDTGDDDEKPVNQQCFDQPFWISRYEITNDQWAQAVKVGVVEKPTLRSDWYADPNMATAPVVAVGKWEALKYAQWLGFQLPTEAQWEYAARGPSNFVYPWGNEFVADNLSDNSSSQPSAVGSHPDGDSWVGVSDLGGSVAEWVSTLYRPYPYNADDGREDLDSDGNSVLRGGNWTASSDSARSANRIEFVSRGGAFILMMSGFRVVRPY